MNNSSYGKRLVRKIQNVSKISINIVRKHFGKKSGALSERRG